MATTLFTPATAPVVTVEVVDYTTHAAAIHAIRTEVFVHEQSIPAQLEIDHDDRRSHHVLAYFGEQVVGTGRLTPAGRIGRVAVLKPLRRRGVGLTIMHCLIETARQNRHREVHLAAQIQAIQFYKKLGFYTEGSDFLEVGIAHIMMRKRL